MSKKILVIEDEKNLARFVSLELQHEGYQVTIMSNGKEGLEEALDKDFDLVLLDLLLPEMDGFEITRRLHAEKTTYVMMMTGRDSVMDIVAGLDRGADDYIIKPFAIEELLARVRAIFRRQDLETSKKDSSAKGDYQDLKINMQNRSVIREGEEISLTKREFDLLNTLVSNANRVMTREDLLANVWKYDDSVETNVVDVYIRYLRGKVDIPGRESYIQTVRGMGYVVREK
ncbi:DNA-binding response regulator, OmpR family, contains REC and winged-helix (wHTH) domain [Streptococcus henryi]|jgi:DNA-binding response OmpR family regulator|uniref:Transcriptional regulatory protein DltR n=1 Tax=Streptococcus henryi TaxID=439219 RepID=A0A1G6C3A5_9STRE|nr:response regulator transcription factor [Streptococcus henryi]SDB27359.1 DNA-binding response regulator, OmpR family, contains REC and winged-helix (wHTH) domain [Streptococcus henryi]